MSAVVAVSSGQPTLLQFTDNLSSVPAGKARFVLSHAADAGELLATLTQLDVANPKTFTMTANPGKEGTLTVPSGTYQVEVTLDGTTTYLTSETISVGRQSATFIYAVGEAANNSVRLARKTVPEVF